MPLEPAHHAFSFRWWLVRCLGSVALGVALIPARRLVPGEGVPCACVWFLVPVVGAGLLGCYLRGAPGATIGAAAYVAIRLPQDGGPTAMSLAHGFAVMTIAGVFVFELVGMMIGIVRRTRAGGETPAA